MLREYEIKSEHFLFLLLNHRVDKFLEALTEKLINFQNLKPKKCFPIQNITELQNTFWGLIFGKFVRFFFNLAFIKASNKYLFVSKGKTISLDFNLYF